MRKTLTGVPCKTGIAWSFDAANGSDGVFTLVVPPRTETVVEYRQLDANASMYLLDGCDPGAECVLGADTNSGQGPERLQIFKESATDELLRPGDHPGGEPAP